MFRAKAVLLLAATAVLAAGAAGPPRKSLPEEERVWLDFVAPIILPAEEKVFLELTESRQFERFKREFWARREAEGLERPLGPGYETRYTELRRLADEVYDGVRNDAGRLVLRAGEPAEIRKIRGCEHVFRDVEIWTYPGGVRGIRDFLFYRPDELQPRRLWDVRSPENELFARDSCRRRVRDLSMDCPGSFQLVDPCRGPVCGEACTVYQLAMAVNGRQHNGLGAEQERGQLMAQPVIATEGVEKVRDMSATAADQKAAPLSVTGPSASVAPTPRAPVKKVAKASKKEAIADLPEDERNWLTDYAAPIITPDEEKLFLELTEDYQRIVFKKDFWARRERDGLGAPYGPGFERRYEELRPKLDSVYDGWRNDAARLVLKNGEPAEIHVVTGCDQTFRDLEIWTFSNLTWARNVSHHLLYRPTAVSPRKLWQADNWPTMTAGAKDQRGQDVFLPGSCRKSLESLHMDCVPVLGDPCAGPVCADACDVYRVYRQILAIQQNPIGGLVESAKLTSLPELSTEGLDGLRKSLAALQDPKARPLGAVGPSSQPRKAPEPTPTPEPRHALTEDEMRDRIVQLDPKYREWLELAAPLLSYDDLSNFLQMTPAERDRYIKGYFKKQK